MIPVLVALCLRPDLIAGMLASVDVPVSRRVVIDNGGAALIADALHMPAGLGVAASWNLALKLTIDAPWWVIASDDVTFPPGSLAQLVDAMADPTPRIVCLADDMAVFAMNAEALDTIGFFDENYHPAYCEDVDIEQRCRITGVPIIALHAPLVHARSATIAHPWYREQNDRTYPRNVEYHLAKWGGSAPRRGEDLASPFGRGGSVADWTLDPRRLRSLRWPRRDDGNGTVR